MKKMIALITVILLSLNMAVTAGNEDNTKGTAGMQTSITGKITDSVTGEALVGVAIKVEGSDIVVYTDFDGNFTVSGVNPGTYNLVTSYVSYGNTVYKGINVDGTNANTVKIQMNPSEE